MNIAVIAYPRISNLDEFQPLRNTPGVRLTWARTPADLLNADWIILPGSKSVAADLAWLRAQGLDASIAHHAAQGKPLLGICGGLQMLGEALIDPHGLDGNAPGLGLLPLVTHYERDKLLRPSRLRMESLSAPWSALAGVEIDVYEIRQGRSAAHPQMQGAAIALRDADGAAIGWQSGAVLGLYAHGLFENPAVLHALFSHAGRSLDAVFEGLGNYVDEHFGNVTLRALITA